MTISRDRSVAPRGDQEPLASGIDRTIGELGKGDHLCLFYENDPAELLHALVPFLRNGLDSGEQCVYVVDDQPVERVRSYLAARGIDVVEEIRRERLVLWTRREWRPEDLDPLQKRRDVETHVEKALRVGFTGVRFAVEMTWTLDPEVDIGRLAQWEAVVNELVPSGLPIRAICQYNRSRVAPAALLSALETHPTVVLGNQTYSNVFYRAPLILHGHSENERVDWMLDRIRQAGAAQVEREELVRALVRAHEDERRRIARDLHDELGQILTALRMTLDRAAKAGNGESSTVEHAGRLVDRLFEQVRELTLRLRPKVLDEHGLLPALRWQIDEVRRSTGLAVDLRHRGVDRRFSADVESAAFRIVQEGLTNVVRHSRVNRAAVRLRADESVLRVTVEDRGRGFDPAVVRRSATGLAALAERAVLLGGRLAVDARPGSGVCLVAELPISSGATLPEPSEDSEKPD